MTPDYHERTSLFAFRDGFLIIGTLLAAACPLLIDTGLSTWGVIPSEKQRFSVMAFLFAPMIILCSLYCVHTVKETFSRNGADDLELEFWSVFKNRPFLILITAFAISALGSNLPATLILYYVEYVLEAHNAEGFLLVYFLTGIVCLPLWIKISRKIGKKWPGSFPW